jgi:1A family penicillin-binding protein
MPIPQLNKRSHYWQNNKSKYSSGSSGFSKNNKPKIPLQWKKRIMYAGLFAIAGCFLIILTAFIWLSRGLPDPNQLIDREVAQSTKILDRTGEKVLYEIHGTEQRTMINLNDLPNYVKQATIAIEDKEFYNHGGISVWGIVRGTVWQTLRGGQVHGGSTLTQQLVKNAILSPERTIKRKFKEWILSYRIEKKFSKDEILQMYLNEIPYGSTAYGVEAASRRYFGKGAKDLELAEAAILAALPQAPSKYSPYGPNKDLLIGRQQYVLDMMAQQGYITKDDAAAAKEYELAFEKPAANIKAPHFVMYIKEILSDKYGEKMVEQGGLRIHTTLDIYKQEIAEDVVREIAKNNSERYNASNAALVSIDPKTGQILAMVGSKDYFNNDIDGQVNITTSSRQPGSSLKPLVYAAAFLKGFTPDTILYDVVTNFSNDPSKTYEPRNYNLKEHGPVSIRKSLAGSLNIPAVKAIYLAGIDKVLDLAREVGYTTLYDRDRYGLSLVLGGGEVKLLEHTNAYGVFAREGIMNPITGILKVESSNGDILEEFESNEKKVLDPKVARQINDILSDNNARSYVFGSRNWLTLGGRPVAAKTGTTNDYRDAWTMGYTPSIVTGVWVGNNDNSAMKRGADGGVVAAPIWNEYMSRVLGDTPVEQFRKPEIEKTGKPVLDGEVTGTKTYRIDRISGLLATEHTPEEYIEERTYNDPHCILYYVDKNNPRGDAPKDPKTDPQFELWESRVRAWAKATSSNDNNLQGPPTEYDNIHTPENRPIISFTIPGNNEVITDSFIYARVNTSAPRGVEKVNYYINDNLVHTANKPPFSLEQKLDFLSNGFHNLKATACDDVGNCSSASVDFNLSMENNNRERNSDASITITRPSGGLAVSSVDFPLEITASISNESIASLVFYGIPENGETITISNISNPKGRRIETNWKTAPPSGTYNIYAEAKTWDNKTITSKKTVITVNNLNEKRD